MVMMSQGHGNAMNVDCAGPVGELWGRSMSDSGQFKKNFGSQKSSKSGKL